jgi:hypothetical protein
MEREQLGALILADLEAIGEHIEQEYVVRIPRLSAVPRDALDEVVDATRQALRSFCDYYVTGTLTRAQWKALRDATFERAGEMFSLEEILEFANIARSMAMDAVRNIRERHPELDDDERAEVVAAMDRYVAELAREEDRLRGHLSSGQLDSVLAELEDEGADLA